jgi:hypothetical protein
MSRNLRNSYSHQYSFTLEREVMRDLGVRISYIGSRGSQLVYLRDVNQAFPSTTRFTAASRPMPQYGIVAFADNGANSLYSGMQVHVQKRYSKGLLVSSAWTWAKSLSEVDDTASQEFNTAIENAYDRRRDRADIVAQPRHMWQNQVLYELPWLRKAKGLTGALFGGWQTNYLVNLATGSFYNATYSGVDASNTGITSGRPDIVKPVEYPKTASAWYDRTAFAVPPANAGRFGTAARNAIVGPGYVIANFGVGKNFQIAERARLQLGASFQNVFNHVNLGPPATTVNVAQGGTITGTHIFPPAGSPRTTQLSLRISY